MTRFRHPLALLLIALLPLGLGGCLFDHPLTSPENVTSPNLDSRFCGVFEFREAKDKKRSRPVMGDTGSFKPEEYNLHRLAVLPLSPARYVIYYRDFSKKPARTLKFRGWISRVDNGYYFSFQDETEGATSQGKYGFFRFVWTYPGDFLLYAPDANLFAGARSSYEMRKILRAGLRNDTAFPYEGTYWKKIARIWWDPAAAETGTSIPAEFEKGTTLPKPGL